MIDQKLFNYINQQLRNGYDINTIRNTLVQQGWDQRTVDDSIYFIYNKNTNQNLNKQEEGNKMVSMKNPHYFGFWIRLLAALLDALILGIPFGILGLGLYFGTRIYSMMYVAQLASIILSIYLEGIKGGTPGKLILGMRIVNEKGNYIGIPAAILRYIGKILSGIIIGIGYLMIAFTEKKQGLHDKIAKTFVVKA